ncbi:short-chain dehydrogenase TIC 32, chloroplastic-like [Wolffia australiana]
MGLWRWPWAAGASGYGGSSTAEQVTEGVDAGKLTAIVTGATSGIGRETARVLALRGAKLILPVRSPEASASAIESLKRENPTAQIEVAEMDVSSLSSVASFASNFNASGQPLNILVNNAGVMACPFQLSKDGVELQFATNHLGHFLLTKLLLEKMKATAKETGIQGRIVNVSSGAHTRADGAWIDLEKINNASEYKAFKAYSRSKLANILHANELSRRLLEEKANVTVNSLHPGVIPTNLFRHFNNAVALCLGSLVKPFMKTVPQGAATTCYLALNPALKDVTGKYFADCNEEVPTSYAMDEELAKKLWTLSEELVEKLEKPIQ